MMLSNQEQAMRLFACLGFGVWLSLWYDVFRVYRLWRRSPRWAVMFQDILFCVSGAVALFLFSLAVSGGDMRPDMLAAVALGFVLCRQTIGRLIMAAAAAVKRVSPSVSRFFERIGTATGAFLQKITKKIGIFSKKGLHHASRLLYNKKQE